MPLFKSYALFNSACIYVRIMDTYRYMDILQLTINLMVSDIDSKFPRRMLNDPLGCFPTAYRCHVLPCCIASLIS